MVCSDCYTRRRKLFRDWEHKCFAHIEFFDTSTVLLVSCSNFCIQNSRSFRSSRRNRESRVHLRIFLANFPDFTECVHHPIGPFRAKPRCIDNSRLTHFYADSDRLAAFCYRDAHARYTPALSAGPVVIAVFHRFIRVCKHFVRRALVWQTQPHRQVALFGWLQQDRRVTRFIIMRPGAAFARGLMSVKHVGAIASENHSIFHNAMGIRAMSDTRLSCRIFR